MGFISVAKFATLHDNIFHNTSINATLKATVNATLNLDAMKTTEAIITLIQTNPDITRQEMAEKTGKNLSTIARAIKKLKQDQQLKRICSDKTGRWQLL